MQWVDVSKTSKALAIDGLDPYADWMLGEAGRFSFEKQSNPDDRLYPILIELGDVADPDAPGRLRPITVAELADATMLFDTPQQREHWHDNVALPPLLLQARDNVVRKCIDAFGFTTAVVRPAFFALMGDRRNLALQRAIRSVSLSRPVEGLELSFRKDVRHSEPDLQVAVDQQTPSEDVVVGIIDDSIAFANERFRYGPTSTRVQFVWIQSQDREEAPTLFGRGRELRKSDIDQALKLSSDEDRIYRKLGLLDFTSRLHKGIAHRGAHGTHVLDVATGPLPEHKPEWPIICVQLPVAVTADTSGARLTQWVVEAAWYILFRSLEIAKQRGTRPMPVVINLSYGFTAGPHDGSLPIERALQRTVDVWERIVGAKVRIVLPAGNHFTSRMHARVKPTRYATAELAWRIHPDDRTASHVELWLPKRPGRNPCPVRIRVCPPGIGTAPGPAVGADAADVAELRDGDRLICQVAYSWMNTSNRGVIRVSVAPTRELDTADGGRWTGAPSGVWKILVENVDLGAAETVEAWVQRDDNAFGFPLVARQSFFEDPSYTDDRKPGRPNIVDTATGSVRRAGTINAIATGADPRIVVVGGYVRSTMTVSSYSSSGPTSGMRTGPDALAVSDRSPVRHGVLAAGPRSGARVAMNGTSVAAPLVTRLIADELAAGRPGDAQFLASVAVQGIQPIGNLATTDAQLKERLGAGFIPAEPGGPA